MKVVLFFIIYTFLACSNLVAGELIVGSVDYEKPWTKLAKSDEISKIMLLKILSNSNYGKKIIRFAKQKSMQKGKTLMDILIMGNGSITDTTLIRRFSKSNPEMVEYQDGSKVYINSNLNVRDAVLDLAHELTHFTYRETFNPYQDGFNFISFLKSTIEKTGGEVDAFIAECHVMKDLFPGRVYEDSKCISITDRSTGRLSKRLAIQKFYQVGPLYSKFWEDSARFGVEKTDFPDLSSEQAVFISSAYSLPYPLATFVEYQSMMTRVCKNDERRLSYMKQKVGRSPASSVKNSHKKMVKSFFDRCANVDY